MSSSVQLFRCKDCGILWPSSKMVSLHSRVLSENKRQNITLRKTSFPEWQLVATPIRELSYCITFSGNCCAVLVLVDY